MLRDMLDKALKQRDTAIRERDNWRALCEAAGEDYLSTRAQLAQEPAAWMRDDGGDGSISTMTVCISTKVRDLWLKANPRQVKRYTIPLYAHPAPAPKPTQEPVQTPMTEEQIETTEWSDDIHTIIRAVERYHGIGEK